MLRVWLQRLRLLSSRLPSHCCKVVDHRIAIRITVARKHDILLRRYIVHCMIGKEQGGGVVKSFCVGTTHACQHRSDHAIAANTV